MCNSLDHFEHTQRFAVRHLAAIRQRVMRARGYCGAQRNSLKYSYLCVLEAGHTGPHYHPDCTDWRTPQSSNRDCVAIVLPLTR
jgi:hypothetical protein